MRSASPPAGLAPGVRDDAVGYGVLDAAAAVRGGPPRTGPEVRPEPPTPPTNDSGIGWITAAVGAAVAVVAVGAVAVRRRRGGPR
ncbi:hypothetical protein [Actinomycetospora sp. CA-053990]|uniref:hypothetical protein n=1 Tax=Actinomycetospora sp. CA-053990 TaxID=3239891 RepID=UPI003D929CB5